MSDTTVIDKFKLFKITALAYNEIKRRESDGRSKEQVVIKIIEIMKKELKEDVD